jgi:CRP-like cAMP-binding protein
MKRKIWCLRRFPLFEGLSEEQVKNLAKFFDERKVGKTQILFEPEDQDKVFFVKSGLVEVYHITEDGKKVVLETLGPGSFFAAIGGDEEQSQFLEAVEDTLICVTSKDRLFEMIAEQPRLARQVVEGLLVQLFEAREQVAVLATGTVRDRLAHLLGRLIRRYGVSRGSKVRIEKRFTHEDLANMIGASRETVTKMLAILEKEGKIKREGRYLIVES